VNHDNAIVDAVFKVLDAQLALFDALYYASPLALLPSPDEYELVKQTILLWASSKDGRVSFDSETKCIRLHLGKWLFLSVHVPDEHAFDPKRPYAVDKQWRPAS
jgi:hypothetical protein